VTANLDEHFWPAPDNTVADNVIRGSGRADIALSGLAGPGNCFEGNSFESSAPVGLEVLNSCDGIRLPLAGDLSTLLLTAAYAADAPDEVVYEAVGAQSLAATDHEQMPGGPDGMPRPAVDVFANYDFAEPSVQVLARDPSESRLEDIFSGPSPWQLLFGLYGYLLPLVLLAAWVSLAFWDLARREDLGRGAALGWIAAILLVPFLGVIAYHAFGARNIAGWLRAAMVGGGVLVYLGILAIGAALGGIV
jgi:hypothetical protein